MALPHHDERETEARMTAGRTNIREHHWDACRALFMLLGIPYHVAMAYRANDVWIVNAGEGAFVFTWLADIIHLFRMPAFFVIAGYFAALLLARRAPGTWFSSRLTRLGIPFVATLLTLNPLLNLFCELSNFSWRPALASWQHNSEISGGYWVRHLWFIIVLLYCSAAAALLCRISPRIRTGEIAPARDVRLARALPLTILGAAIAIGLWEAIAIELFYMGGLATNLPQQILRLDQVIEFAPWFLAGWLVARAPAVKAALYRPSAGVALMGLVALGIHYAVGAQLHPAAGRFVDTIVAVSMTQMLVAAMKRLADRPHPLVQEFVRASFVIYLFHLPIVAGLVVMGQPVAAPVVLKASVIMVLTLALSYAAWLVVARFPTLRLLFDGIRPAAADAARTLPSRPLATRELGSQHP